MALSKLQSYLLGGLLFLLPLFFLPITGDFFDFNKTTLLVVGVLAGLVLWGVSGMRGEFKIRVTALDLPILLFAAAVLLSSLSVPSNKITAFVFPGEATVILAATFLYFLITQNVKRPLRQSASEVSDTQNVLLDWLLAGGAVAGLISVLSVVGAWGMAAKFAPVPAWMNQAGFTTLGLPLSAMTFFIALLPLAIGRLVKGETPTSAETSAGRQNVKRKTYSILYTLYTILIVAGLAATVYNALPGKPAFPKTLPFDTGWSVALETLKRAPIFGVGPGNFVEAFGRFRPVEYNLTDVWNLRFSSSSNWYLHVFTTAGLLGIVTLGLVLWSLYRMLKDGKGGLKEAVGGYAVHYSLFAILVLFLFLPAGMMLVILFYVFMALFASEKARDVRLELAAEQGDTPTFAEASAGRQNAKRETNLLPAFFTLISVLGLVLVLYFGSRVYAAEVAYREALNAVVANDGIKAYNKMIEAIQKNPRVARYHVDYSQINLALANNIASKKDLTDKERQTVSQLIQQAIAQGKAGVALGQSRVDLWENLARIYQSLIPAAQGADQFAIATYQQAIALDPVNPELRIALGGVFYGLGRYEDAVRVFELAVAAKPNHPNAHFNLASALREKKDTARATQEMEQVLGLVDVNSQDYKTAQTELDKLKGKLKEEQEATVAAQKAETLRSPAQQPASPPIKPPIALPAESAPPATESAVPSPIPVPGQ